MIIAWTKTACLHIVRIALFFVLLGGAMSSTPDSAQAIVRPASMNATNSASAESSAVVLRPLMIARTCAGCGQYSVRAGDSLYSIAERFAVPGGWPALYAANRQSIGSDPDLVRVGLAVRVPSTRPAPALPQVSELTPVPAASTPALAEVAAMPTQPRAAPSATSTPAWLPMMLVASGVALVGLLAEPAMAVRRRRSPSRSPHGRAGELGPGPSTSTQPQLHVTDHERLLVTRIEDPATIVVCRPPRQDPEVILSAARLVLSSDDYAMLASHLERSPHAPRSGA